MPRHIRLNQHRLFETITYCIVNIIMIAVLVIHGWHYLVSEAHASDAKSPPAATRNNQPMEELATEDLDEDSSVPTCNGTGDHTPSKSTASRLRRHGKAPPGRSCSDRMCCRTGK